ncbi:MAG: Asp-tRNA(Asn)/Glu-tRNA(Gln) amidotransferase subunit GatB [Candidatus Brocadiia bacterium]|nr:MAG: Asp-tRNA(Asn)/Glu-tRNA(Gln) amidotransferase subunit GatB [Candidatus Brocadiia bacterium]
MSDIKYKVLVGLEIHVHLATKTKMFCGCSLEYGIPGNSRVCPVCLGLPGSLPVMNRDAIEHSVLVGLALHCEIPEFTKWDRKNYYYPDMPKNYQISQYDLPLSKNGFMEIPLDGGRTKNIRIIRAHLEEDAGKNVHTESSFSQVDLNRAGSPLLEIVTQPDLGSGAEVRAMAEELQRIVRYLGISHGDMQKGHMRFEPNINLVITRDGKEFRTPIVEVKNLNSFRALERSIDYEVTRQLDEFIESGKTMEMGNKTTRGWDAEKQVTFLQREKEEAHDYRYFPEPDLVPVEVKGKWLDEIKSRLCELPVQRKIRYINQFGLNDYDASVLTAERATAEFYEQAVNAGGEPKRLCNILTQVGLKLANEKGCSVADLGVTPASLADLAKMTEAGDISATASAAIFEQIVNTGKEPRSIAEELNLIQKSDAGELESVVDEVIAANQKAVEDVVSGSKKAGKARGFLLGQVIQKTKGRANPKVVSEIMDKKLK